MTEGRRGRPEFPMAHVAFSRSVWRMDTYFLESVLQSGDTMIRAPNFTLQKRHAMVGARFR